MDAELVILSRLKLKVDEELTEPSMRLPLNMKETVIMFGEVNLHL